MKHFIMHTYVAGVMTLAKITQLSTITSNYVSMGVYKNVTSPVSKL